MNFHKNIENKNKFAVFMKYNLKFIVMKDLKC